MQPTELVDSPSQASCPLCHGQSTARMPGAAVADSYIDCLNCGLVFLEPSLTPDRDREYAHYLTHENDPADKRYRHFLSRLADPLMEKLTPGMKGLDFGSGPGPTLSLLLEEAGYQMSIYDPFFAPDREVLSRRYDFITCSETVEHFHRPSEEFERFGRLLKRGGVLGVMTEMLEPETIFADWWYRRDPTHVCFYRRKCMRWIADSNGWAVTFPGRNIAIFQLG